MSVPRQGGSSDSGRTNQKRRTRASLVEAARDLVCQGATPTVAQVAEAALVSRTTAYRYFPTQESLLVELAISAEVDHIEALVDDPAEGVDPAEQVVEVLQAFNRHVIDNEVEQRSLLRLYADHWLTAVCDGQEPPVVREGRRVRWYADTLARLGDRLPAEQRERLVSALALLSGIEGVTTLHDVCQLDDDDALAVTEWAARALVRAALDEAAGA